MQKLWVIKSYVDDIKSYDAAVLMKYVVETLFSKG